MKKPHPTEIRDQAIIDNAAYFTASIRKSPVERYHEERPTQAEAEAVGRQMAAHCGKKALIYAVNVEGRSAFVCSVGA